MSAAPEKEKAFSLLRGRRILVKKPLRKETATILDEATEAALDKEMVAKWTRLEVFAVGKEVEDVKPGDLVFISPESVGAAGQIPIDDQIYMMVNEYDIAIVW